MDLKGLNFFAAPRTIQIALFLSIFTSLAFTFRDYKKIKSFKSLLKKFLIAFVVSFIVWLLLVALFF